jgi:uncharacterized membrane protein
MKFLKKHLPECLLGLAILMYCAYFIFTSIIKMRYLYGNYFDIGIMHQTVFNTFKAFTTFDFSRFLEMTDPYGPMQVKRMAIHNDPILAFMAPFYIFWSGPETLLVLQTLILAAGSIGLYLISLEIFKHDKIARWFGLLFAVLYLLNPSMQNSNLFEFHGVTLATSLIIFMFYFWLKKRLWISFIFFILTLLTKEQIGLTTAFFGFYVLWTYFQEAKYRIVISKKYIFPIVIILLSISWFYASLEWIIPMARGGTNHFALEYYGEFGDSPSDVVFSVLKQPTKAFEYIFHQDALTYLLKLFQPVGFLAFFSPLTLAIAAPEFGVNLISQNSNMRLIIYHYTAVLTSFIFIATILGTFRLYGWMQKKISKKTAQIILFTYLLVNVAIASYSFSSLPYAVKGERYIFNHPFANRMEVFRWSNELKSEEFKVSSTGKLAPFFTSRRYFYILSSRYDLADYVILNPQEVFVDFGSENAIPAYEALQTDKRFVKIYDENNLQVYKKVAR